jgi:RNA polymerase sigma factor (sigma-70 family)
LAYSEPEILKGLKEGREDAFRAIIEMHYQSLFAYGRRFSRDGSVVEDCIQDVFVNVWKNRGQADTIIYLKQYLLTALKRRILRVLAQDKTRIASANGHSREYNFSMEFSIEDIIIEKQLVHEKAQKLRQVVDQLTDRQKEVIYLYYYQQMDHGQVAAVMDISRQSVYNLLYEGIRKIRVFWQEVSLLLLLFFRQS